MGALIKLVALLISINTFMYVGIAYTFAQGITDTRGLQIQGDFFDLYLEDKEQFGIDIDTYIQQLEGGENISVGVNVKPSDEWTSMPDQEAGERPISRQGFTFLDIVRIIWAFVATLINIVMLPLILFSTSIFPPLVTLVIGIPLAALTMIVIILGALGGRPT